MSVNYGDDAATIKKYVKEGGFRFPIVMNVEGKGDVTQLYGVQAFPTNYILDADGKIVAALEGFDEDAMKHELRKLGFGV